MPMRRKLEQDYLCNNRQCKACKYILVLDGRRIQGVQCWCNYMSVTGQSRNCEIPFCDKYEQRKGFRKPKNLTEEDFKNYYKCYPKEQTK